LKKKNATTKVQTITTNNVSKEKDFFGCCTTWSLPYPVNSGLLRGDAITFFLKFIGVHKKSKIFETQ